MAGRDRFDCMGLSEDELLKILFGNMIEYGNDGMEGTGKEQLIFAEIIGEADADEEHGVCESTSKVRCRIVECSGNGQLSSYHLIVPVKPCDDPQLHKVDDTPVTPPSWALPSLEMLPRRDVRRSPRTSTRRMLDVETIESLSGLWNHLRSHANCLILEGGWALEVRKRSDCTKNDYIYRAPSGGPCIFSLPKAWKAFGKWLSWKSAGSREESLSREWTGFDEFLHDLKNTLMYIERAIQQVRQCVTLQQQWQLLNPFVEKVFIQKQVGLLRQSSGCNTVNLRSDFEKHHGGARRSLLPLFQLDSPSGTTSGSSSAKDCSVGSIGKGYHLKEDLFMNLKTLNASETAQRQPGEAESRTCRSTDDSSSDKDIGTKDNISESFETELLHEGGTPEDPEITVQASTHCGSTSQSNNTQQIILRRMLDALMSKQQLMLLKPPEKAPPFVDENEYHKNLLIKLSNAINETNSQVGPEEEKYEAAIVKGYLCLDPEGNPLYCTVEAPAGIEEEPKLQHEPDTSNDSPDRQRKSIEEPRLHDESNVGNETLLPPAGIEEPKLHHESNAGIEDPMLHNESNTGDETLLPLASIEDPKLHVESNPGNEPLECKRKSIEEPKLHDEAGNEPLLPLASIEEPKLHHESNTGNKPPSPLASIAGPFYKESNTGNEPPEWQRKRKPEYSSDDNAQKKLKEMMVTIATNDNIGQLVPYNRDCMQLISFGSSDHDEMDNIWGYSSGFLIDWQATQATGKKQRPRPRPRLRRRPMQQTGPTFCFDDDDLIMSSVINRLTLRYRKPSSKRSTSTFVSAIYGVVDNVTCLQTSSGVEYAENSIANREHAGSRTGWHKLLETGILTRNTVLRIRKPGEEVVKEGRIGHRGVHCSCCGQYFTVSAFRAHAGFDSQTYAMNMFIGSAKPYVTGLLQAWLIEYNSRKAGLREVVAQDDQNYDNCSLCGDGGELVCCDNCPASYHVACLPSQFQDIPEESWYCLRCICELCGEVINSRNELGASPCLECAQCECKYHTKCVTGVVETTKKVGLVWFCTEDCKQVYISLHSRIGVADDTGDGFYCSVLRCSHGSLKSLSAKGISVLAECHMKLAVALGIIEESFLPLPDPQTGINMIPLIIYNWKWKHVHLNFKGFYTIVLEKDDRIISVASVRVLSKMAAEMPLIATCSEHRGEGMCRRLFWYIEEMLKALDVETLLLSAAPGMVDVWISSFGFDPTDNSDKDRLYKLNLVSVPGTILLKKRLAGSSHSIPGSAVFPGIVRLASQIGSLEIAPAEG